MTILEQTPVKTLPISPGDRLQQTYVTGATGTGKSTLFLRMILGDIAAGHGVCVLDPHGDLLKDVLCRMDTRLDDVVLLSLTNPHLPFGLNLFHCPNIHDPIVVHNTVSMVTNIFEKVFGLARSTMGRQLTYLRSLIYLFIFNPDVTPLEISKILNADTKYDRLRLRLVANLPPTPGYEFTRQFWTEGFSLRAKRAFQTQDNELFGILWKFQEMTSDLLYPFFCQKQTVDFSQLMKEKKIVLCKLNSDWPDVTSLVGSILIGQILHAGYLRRHAEPFYVYCDEFQNFATYDFARLFAEARKFKIALTIATQTETQIPTDIREICKQAGNLFVFRVTARDSHELSINFDNTPPPGEWIYEKQMRRAGENYVVEFWDPLEAEDEYERLGREIQLLTSQVRERENNAKWFSNHSELTYIPQPVTSLQTMTQELWKAVEERIMQYFKPDYTDPEVAAYYRSFYTDERRKIHKSNKKHHWEWVRDYYDLESKRWDEVDVAPFEDLMLKDYPDGYYHQLRLAAPIQKGGGYTFPAHFPCHFNYKGELPPDFLAELKAMYEPYKRIAKYYFDFERYGKDYHSISGNLETSYYSCNLIPNISDHWKGPYFNSDTDWLAIIRWINNKYSEYHLRMRQFQQQLLLLQEQQQSLYRNYESISKLSKVG